MVILSIDPGETHSGVVLVDTGDDPPIVIGVWTKEPNHEVLKLAAWDTPDLVLIEMMKARGMPVSDNEMETMVWIGRFLQAAGEARVRRIYRADVKLAICGSSRANDSNIRRAVLDTYPSTGGGKTPQHGTKKQPGPLYGVANHAFPALAVALTWLASEREGR